MTAGVAERGYRIGEVAERVGVTTRTIRYYEELGLLGDARRPQQGRPPALLARPTFAGSQSSSGSATCSGSRSRSSTALAETEAGARGPARPLGRRPRATRSAPASSRRRSRSSSTSSSSSGPASGKLDEFADELAEKLRSLRREERRLGRVSANRPVAP